MAQSLGNRAAAQKFILAYIDKLLPGSENKKIYEDMFSKMSDKDFDAYIAKLENKQTRLVIVAPNMSKFKLDVKRNIEIGKELGHNFFQRIWMDSGDNTPKYLTPIPYLVVKLPLRRQAQILVKKISIPEDNKSVDYLTGQPTGSSKGAKISYPELQVLAARGLDNMTVELIKYRGGDQTGFTAMNNSISKTGGVSLKALDTLGTRVKSTQTLSTYLTCMHYSNTLTQ